MHPDLKIIEKFQSESYMPIQIIKYSLNYFIELCDGFSRLMWCQNLEIKFYNLNAIYLDTKLLQSRQFFKQTWQERRQARNTYICFQKYDYILLMMR